MKKLKFNQTKSGVNSEMNSTSKKQKKISKSVKKNSEENNHCCEFCLILQEMREKNLLHDLP